jgi:hypothetical protein
MCLLQRSSFMRLRLIRAAISMRGKHVLKLPHPRTSSMRTFILTLLRLVSEEAGFLPIDHTAMGAKHALL